MNYEKLYKRLKKEINNMKKDELSYEGILEDNSVMKAVETRASQYAGHCLEQVLLMAEEIEGKKHHNILMNKKEFEKNKEKICHK